MRTRDEGEPPPLFGPSRVFRYFEAWKYRGWLTNILIVVTIVGIIVLGELDVHLPYWLLGLLGGAIAFGTFGVAEVVLRRKARRG
jgi:hypothetical protein